MNLLVLLTAMCNGRKSFLENVLGLFMEKTLKSN